MSRFWKLALWIAGSAFAVFVVVEIVLAGRDIPIPSGSEPMTLHAGAVGEHSYKTRSWSFRYDKAQVTADGTLATIDNVHDGVYYKDGKPYIKLTARHAQVNTQNFDFNAVGDVHVVQLLPHGQRRTFDTDDVLWTNSAQTLYLPHTSVVRTGDQVLRVGTVTVNFRSGEIKLQKIRGGFQI